MPQQTGPTSRRGKLISAMNHFQHGGVSQTLFIKGENPDDFLALLENAFEQHQPAFDQDADLVTASVRARWIVKRRHRAAETFESALYERQPDSAQWLPTDLHTLALFDRYTTQAERALTRAIRNLQTIQKMARDDQRWQLHLTQQKEKIAPDIEHFAQTNQTEEPTPPIQQTLFIGYEDEVTTVYEVTPTNTEIHATLTPSDKVTRTYNLIGGVPPSYTHLITPDAIRWGLSTSVTKTYTSDEWTTLTNQE